MSYELFQKGPEVYIPILLISLIVTVIAYSAFPIIFAIARKNRITKKKYRGLCYGINAAVMLVFIIINDGDFSGAPYFLWTWVFSSLGAKILGTRNIIIDGDSLSKDNDYILQCKSCGYKSEKFFDICPKCGNGTKQYVRLEEGAALNNKILFCRKCGNRLIENSRFCSKCGFSVQEEEKS